MTSALVAQETGVAAGLLLAALLLGLRHGIDWDHIAAISDITAANDTGTGLRLGTLYAVGHGAVVFVLGVVALVVGSRVPPGVDDVMGRIAGATLLVLAAVVLWSLLRERGQFRMRSRWLLLIVTVRRAARRLTARRRSSRTGSTHTHQHVAIAGFHHGDDAHVVGAECEPGTRLRAPTHRHSHGHDNGWDQGPERVAVGVGMLHGVGAETPTQVILFLATAHAGGPATGIAVLLAFLAGLLASNSAITVLGATGFRRASTRPTVHVALATVTTLASVVIGTALVFGNRPVAF